jgi:pyocin large subunit-like protein
MPSADAQQIANGHAWTKHQANFPECGNVDEFVDLVDRIMTNPSATRKLAKGRQAFWEASSNTVVIRDPSSPDLGTAFRPKHGKAYFDNLK